MAFHRYKMLTYRLPSIDDELYTNLLDEFPEFKFEENLRELNEDEMKSVKGKERWRKFIMPVCPPILFRPPCYQLTDL